MNPQQIKKKKAPQPILGRIGTNLVGNVRSRQQFGAKKRKKNRKQLQP